MNKPRKIPSMVARGVFESYTKEFGFYVMWLWSNCVAFCVRIQPLISSVLVIPNKIKNVNYGPRQHLLW